MVNHSSQKEEWVKPPARDCCITKQNIMDPKQNKSGIGSLLHKTNDDQEESWMNLSQIETNLGHTNKQRSRTPPIQGFQEQRKVDSPVGRAQAPTV